MQPILDELIPLNLLRPGQSAKVDQFVGQDDQVHRLQEMGLRVGTTIEMVQPGSPCIVRVGERKLSFREGDVFQVLVRAGFAS